MEKLKQLGFQKNTKKINGFIPHYTKGNDVLFILNSSFSGKKIARIGKAFKNYEGKIFGVISDDAPRLAGADWAYKNNTILLGLNPLSVGQNVQENPFKVEYQEIKDLHHVLVCI